MAEWRALTVQVPGKDVLEPVRGVLEQLLILLDVLKAVLNTIKSFLIDFGNPLRILVESLIRIIEELFLSLKASGAFALYHVPNPTDDPNFQDHTGYDRFAEVFKQSLFDTKDFNRPQPRAGSTKGGFVLMMVQADSPYTLLARINTLLEFFSKKFTAPRFEAPRNVKAQPVDLEGTPLVSVASLFSERPEAIQLSWSLPTSAETPDTGFSDLVSRVASEFVPPKFLVERSTVNPASQTIDISQIKAPSAAGRVEFSRTVPVAGTSTSVSKREFLLDSYGELVVKFTESFVVDPGSVEGMLGQLGTFRYVDRNIDPDTTYYYRVRALAGNLQLDDGQIAWGSPKNSDGREIPRIEWPAPSDEEVVVGKPSGIVSARIPTPIPDFDVIENLRRVFLVAFSSDFHRQIRGEDDLLGTGTLVNLAGPVGGKEFFDVQSRILRAAPTIVEAIAILESDSPISFPWEHILVRKQSGRLADSMASAMIQTGGTTLERFRSLMQSVRSDLGGSLEEALAFVEDDVSTLDKASSYVQVYNSNAHREALSEVITFLKSFTGGGITPDWVSVNPLRDIVPWAGQILYDLLDKVQSLVDAFAGVNQEIKNFVDLLTRKVETLERTLEFLVSILSLVESLKIGAYILVVPEVEGSAVEWVRTVDSASGSLPLAIGAVDPSAGNQPVRGPGGYSGGVALAYVGSDIAAFRTAFSIIFGGS